MRAEGNIRGKFPSCEYMRSATLIFFLLGWIHLSWAQSSVLRSFTETGGSVTTGNAGSVNSFSNGDILVANERWTNFSQKGLQLFRLKEEGLSILNSRAYFNNFTITNIKTAVRDDSVFVLASHVNGGVNKLLFMVFDSDLALVRTKLIEGGDVGRNINAYSFFAANDGSFRVFGYTYLGTDSKKLLMSLDPMGEVIWSLSPNGIAQNFSSAALLPDGTLVCILEGDYIGVDKNGGVKWSKSLGADFVRTIDGVVNKNGEAMFCQATVSPNDSSSFFAVRIDASGNYSGVTASAFSNGPKFFESLANGMSIMGSSSFAGDAVHLKISLFESNGKYVKSLFIDNVYGYAPTGALYDACKYSAHVDAKGNLLVLGVANRQGFFVFRYNPDLGFECGYETSSWQPSPVPELSGASYSLQHLSVGSSDYTFQEEAPGNYKPVCLACGSALQENLIDTTLCLDTARFTLNAGNGGAQYLWDDGTTSSTRTIVSDGTYWVRISNDCDTLIDSVDVQMIIRPKVKAGFSPEEPIPGDPILFTASPDTFSLLQWYQADTLFYTGSSFFWTPVKNGDYRFVLQAGTYEACAAFDTVDLSVVLLDYYFPTAFTPDKDGNNDTWGPVGNGIATYRMEVYNRWGQKIVALEDENWDGTIDGTLVQDGLYMYLIWLTEDDGVARHYKGNVYLLR